MQWLKSPSEKLLRSVAILVLVFVALVMGWGVYRMGDLNTHYSMSQFMPKDHPLFGSDRLIKTTFKLSEREPIILNLVLPASNKGTWLDKNLVDLIERSTAELAGIAQIEKVLSLSNVEMASNTSSGIQVDRLLRIVPEAEWKSRVLKDHLLTPGLVSKDGRVTTLIAEISNLSEAEMNELMDQIKARLGVILNPAGVKLMVSGVLPLQTQMATLLSKELVNFFGLAFLVCVITLVAYFRSYSTVFLCLILVVIANIATFATLAVLGIPFSVLSSALPIMCSIEALAIGSHTLLIFGDNYRLAMNQPNPASKAQVVWSTFKNLIFPNFLMSTTTIIGFATLISSQVPLIRQFSESVSGGILMSCIFMQIAMPSLMYLFPIPVARSWTGAKARWALWVIHNRRAVVLGVLAAVAIFMANGLRLNWAVHLYDDLPQVNDIKTSADLIDRKLGGMIPLQVMISKSGEENPWYEPARIQKLRNVLARWRKEPSIGSSIGLPDLLNTGINPPKSRQAIAETIFLYSFSGAENPATQFLSNDGSATRLSFRMKDVNADKMGFVIRAITEDVKKEFPGFEVKTGGMAATVHPLNAELSQDLIYGLWHSLALITILLILVFRSVRLAFIAAVPNLLPPLALLATMAYLKTPVKPVVAIIFSIALGLAYNNTIFLLTRLKKVQQSFKGATDVIMRTWYQEGNPCLFSSLAVIGGFAVFLASYFSPNRTFGAYMLWSIGVGLVGDLILLPALLRMFPWFIFPGESPRPATANAGQRGWSRNLLLLFALITGMGPSAAAAAEKVVHSPFQLNMKKDTFGQLVFDGAIGKATGGEKTNEIPLDDISIVSPVHIQVSGVSLKLKYTLDAPADARKPSEWLLQSRRVAAELYVAKVEAHETREVKRGEDTIVVRLDGICTDVKLALPEGTASVQGRLVLGARDTAPRMLLKDFKANWMPGSWQVVSMNCSGPKGFDEAVANAAKDRLVKIDPYFDTIRDSVQQELDKTLAKDAPREFVLGNPLQPGETLLLKNLKTSIIGQDSVVRGDAYFYFKAAKEGCGADIRDFAQSVKSRSGDTSLTVPFSTLKALFVCAHADGSMAFDTDSQKFSAFNELMHSGMQKNAVWPDLNSYPENSVMRFHGVTASVPQLTNEKPTGEHQFSARLQQRMNVMMYAPKERGYIPYTAIQASFSGPVRVTLAGSKVSIQPEGSGELGLDGQFVQSYLDAYRPAYGIDWTRIQPEAQKALLAQGWSFALPTWGVSSRVLLKVVDGDLVGSNFRLGLQVIRR